MEIVDNAIILLDPGSDGGGSHETGSSGAASRSRSLIAGVAAYPVNRWLIARGRGHAVVHAYH